MIFRLLPVFVCNFYVKLSSVTSGKIFLHYGNLTKMVAYVSMELFFPAYSSNTTNFKISVSKASPLVECLNYLLFVSCRKSTH